MDQLSPIRRAALLSGAVVLAACSGDNLVLPGDGSPSAVALVSGDRQTAEAGRVLPESLVIRVTDHNQDPVGGVAVQWTVTGGGSVSSHSTTTGADGRSGVVRTLGPVPGPQTTTAQVSGASAPVSFTATAVVSTIRLALDGAPPDSIRSGQAISPPLTVQLRDPSGNPIARADVPVTVAIASGGGTLGGTTTRATDGEGSAAFDDLVLEGSAGPRTLIFAADSAAGLTVGPIVLTAGAVNASRSSLAADPSSVPASDGSTTATVTLAARDENGSPVAGAAVTFSATGGAVLRDADRTTGSDGTAQVRVSATSSGTKQVTASVDGVTVGPATVTVVPAAAAAGKSSAVAPDGTAGQTTTVLIQLRDGFGNPVAGGSSQLAVTVAGANSAQASISDRGGGTYGAEYTPTVAGTDQITVKVNGTALQGGALSSQVSAGAVSGSHSTADVPQLTVYQTARVTVQARDSYGNPVHHGGANVVVTVNYGAGAGGVAVTDQGDGTYTADFPVLWSGNYTIRVLVEGEDVVDSPFHRRASF